MNNAVVWAGLWVLCVCGTRPNLGGGSVCANFPSGRRAQSHHLVQRLQRTQRPVARALARRPVEFLDPSYPLPLR
jgi:hypothetical protein